LAALKAKASDRDQSTIYKNLIWQEKQKKAAKKMRRILGNIKSEGLLFISVAQDNEIIEVTSKEEIELACHEENAKKFTQTNNMPAIKGGLLQELEFLGDIEACEQILQSLYIPLEDTDPYTKEFLSALAQSPSLVQTPKVIISTAKFQIGWNHINEWTSSSSSFIYFGHMKAYASYPSLAYFEATVSHIPYSTSYTPSE
jgi:hypothetical protein